MMNVKKNNGKDYCARYNVVAHVNFCIAMNSYFSLVWLMFADSCVCYVCILLHIEERVEMKDEAVPICVFFSPSFSFS